MIIFRPGIEMLNLVLPGLVVTKNQRENHGEVAKVHKKMAKIMES